MKIFKWMSMMAACAVVIGCDKNTGGTAENRYSTESGVSRGTNALAADNSGKNVRDRSDVTLTPEEQGVSDADRETTRKVRRALMANDQLSVTAKNIKIITVNGKVTLRGPVNSTQERELVDSIVKQLGLSAIDDQLEIKTTTTNQ
jgi:hyperosmotically inducible periplasmic protein